MITGMQVILKQRRIIQVSAEEDELFKQAVEKWGAIAQVDMMIEEMAELTKALLKHRRYITGKANYVPAWDMEWFYTDAIKGEICDVFIMLQQMVYMYGSIVNVYKEKVKGLRNKLAEEG